jgi:uncharacterized protein (TIGR03435 family)
MSIITRIVLVIVGGAASLLAQTPPRPAFEVASIRPSSNVPPQGFTAGAHIDGSQFRTSYLTLKDYIGVAYRLKLYQISGPDWIGTNRFDVAATLPAGSLPAQASEMMQTLLEERFKLKQHLEKKEFPVYALEVVKGGLKIQESPPNPELDNADAKAPQSFTGGGSNQGVVLNLGRGSSVSFVDNKFEAKRISMPMLAGTLERFLDRPIVDMTGLDGNYDLSVEITPDDYRAMLIRSAVVAGVVLPPEVLRVLDGASSPASLFDNLQKLGLRLEARKAPLDLLVVDSVLKTPTEN